MKNNSQQMTTFRQLHEQQATFILPNAWDVISAVMFEQCGFKALGTTSAGIATSLGYKDGEHIRFEEMLIAVKRIVSSVNIPVTVDIETGYGETTTEIIENIKRIIKTGAVGINLEDGTGNASDPLHDLDAQVEKITAIKQLSEENPVFLNARTDTYWLNVGDEEMKFTETVKRANAFERAGADCIFIPGLTDESTIERVRKEISVPINLLAAQALPTMETLTNIGIERVSSGSAPFRASATLVKHIGEELINEGTFHRMMDDVMPYGEVTQLMNE
ncbi:MAG TPA: isocitrate lyase/phosphoenolpyruvate mutase family protein [Bacillota bacterium]|nr:isocitrate lyase/phosphoenolpyruvate mutase family protein [Bacillota bacterium]